MAVNDRKHTVLGETDQPSRAALNAMLASVNDVVPVADTTERAAVATAIGPTSTRPLFVYRADAPTEVKLEVTEDGTNWRSVKLGPTPFALLEGTGTDPVASGPPEIVVLNVATKLTGFTANLTTGTLTAQRPGRFLVSGMVSFSANGTGRRVAAIYKNGASVPQTNSASTPAASGAWRVATATYPLALQVNDTLQLAGLQESGSTLDFVRSECFLQATWIGEV